MNRRETGQAGEQAAASFLSAKGFAVLARNWRKGSLELDLICQNKDTIVFVEVRTRAASGKMTPAETMTPTKCRNFLRAVRAWLAEHDRWSSPCRCDLVSVTVAGDPPSFSVEHIPNVIELDALSAPGTATSSTFGHRHTAWQPW